MKTQHIPILFTAVLLAGVVCLFFAGCATQPFLVTPKAPAQSRIDSRVAAAVMQAAADAVTLPDSPVKAAVQANLEVAASGLAPAQRADIQAAKSLSLAAIAGDIAKATELAQEQQAALASLKIEARKQVAANTAKLAGEQEQARQVHNAFVSRVLQWGGLGCIGVTVIFLAIYKLAGLSSVWPLPIVAVGLFALADFITSKWFYWGERIVGGLVIVAAGVYIYEEYRNRTLVANLQTAAVKVGTNLKNVDIGGLWTRLKAWASAAVAWVRGLFHRSAPASSAATPPAA